MGRQGGNLSLWGPERFFSFVVIAILTYSLFGRAQTSLLWTNARGYLRKLVEILRKKVFVKWLQ